MASLEHTVPVQRRRDFKHALSTLRQLKEKEAAAQRRQRWTQNHSSSSWWSWQGSWWTPYSYESHHGDEASTYLNKATCYTSIWNNSSGHDFLEFIYFVTNGSFTADGGLL